MPDLVQIKRGLSADLPEEVYDGELLLCTDTKELFAGINGKPESLSFDAASYLTSNIPVPVNIGGIKKGETFDNVHLLEIVKRLIYPYTSPKITFSSNQPTLVEKGTQVASLNLSIKVEKIMYDIKSVQLYKNDQLLKTWTNVKPNFNEPVNISYNETNALSENTTYKIQVEDEEETTQHSFKISFILPVFTGFCKNRVPETTDLQQANKILIKQSSFSAIFNTSGQRMMICYPQEWGELKNIKDVNQFDITNTFEKQTMSHTIASDSYNYYVYTSNLTSVKNFKVFFNF